MLVSSLDMVLEEPAGFVIELETRECASPSNTVSLLSPTSDTLTTTMCQEPIGTTWPNSTVYPVGTTITLDFFSGFFNRPGNLRFHSGGYPEWTIEAEDGNPETGDWNDFVLVCRALIDCQMFEQPAPTALLDDVVVKDLFKRLADLTGFDQPLNTRRERAAYVYQKDGQIYAQLATLLEPLSSCMARTEPGELDALLNDPEILVRAFVHTHPAPGGPSVVPEECWSYDSDSGEVYLIPPGREIYVRSTPSRQDLRPWTNQAVEVPYEGWMLHSEQAWRWFQTGGPFGFLLNAPLGYDLYHGEGACIP
jgi:hypothetical protein